MNKTAYWPPVNSMAIGRYKNADAMNPRGGYWELYDVNAQISDDKNGHYVRPNMVALKYLDLKKDVDLDVHVRMFNFVVKANAKTFWKICH